MTNSLSSCAEAKPLMILDPEGLTKAPILDYNLPQQTSFTTYGSTVIAEMGETTAEQSKFTDEAKQRPYFAQRILDGYAFSAGIGGQFLLEEDPNDPTSISLGSLPIFGLEGVNSNQLRTLSQASNTGYESNTIPTHYSY